MFFNADDDEQDFMSPGGSKLASIFGMDKSSGGNESLTYTAPKQPKKKEPAPEGSIPSVAVASVVTAYKYVDNNYASQGKLGAALLANQASKDYRILLYVNKQQQVTNAKITPSFSFNIQKNNYATFYDDARQTWSVMFDTTDNAVKFAREMAISKANSAPAVTELIQQDLIYGDGGALEQGDSVEVKYTGWLFTNGALGKVFDKSQGDHLFRFKVGKGKVIRGWDQGMLGMRKGGKRLLIIPPNMAYGSQGVADRIPPESILAFEVEVIRVKLQKAESSSSELSTAPAPAPVPMPATAASPGPDSDDFDDTTVKGRTRSINEQMSHPSGGGKSKLISRMAKMGQPMLPFQGAVAAHPDDSDEDGHAQPPSPKPTPPVKSRSSSSVSSSGAPQNAHPNTAHISAAPTQGPAVSTFGLPQGSSIMVGGQPMVVDPVTGILQPQAQAQQPAFLHNLPGAQQLAVYQNPNMLAQHQQQQQQQQQAALLQQQQQLLQQQMLGQTAGFGGATTLPMGGSSILSPAASSTPATPSSSQPSDALTPALLTESRQQNTEVRIALSKVSDKVDKVLEKIEQQGFAGASMTPYGSSYSTPSMEANVLMQNVMRIVQENERLKKEVYDQASKVQELNDRMASLLEKNQKFVEQSQTALEQRNEGYKQTASQSQARVLSLEQEKVHLATELSTASSQISTLQLELAEIRRREGELKQRLQDTSTSSSNTKEEVERLTAQREEDEQKISTLTETLREHKQARKSMEAKLLSSTEELADLKSTNSTLEKSLSDRKRKAAEERRKLEEDMEDAKISYEQTIESLRERLRKQKKSVDVETENKVSQIEDEISREWQAKCDKMLSAAAAKHTRQLEEVNEEKSSLETKVNMLERKLEAVRSSGSTSEQQVTELKDELSEMRVWKEKYDNLRSQATAMKEKYEDRIKSLEEEQEEAEEQQRSEVQALRQQLQQARAEAKTVLAGRERDQLSQSAPEGGADIATEVKKIMNTVFQTLRGEFEADESYTGSEVMASVLKVIKDTTLSLVNKTPQKQEIPEEEEDEEEEEEEEEEDEEEGEEDEDKSDKTITTMKEEASHASYLKETPALSETKSEPEVSQASEEVKEEAQPAADSRSSEGTGSDFEMVPESGIDQEIDGAGDESLAASENVDEKADEPASSGDATPVKEIEQDETEEKTEDHEGMESQEEKKQEPDDVTEEVSEVAEEKKQEPDDVIEAVSQVAEDTSEGAQHVDVVPQVETSTNITEQSQSAGTTPIEDDSREPPPLFDDDEEDQDSPLFGKDDTVSETLGAGFSTKPKADSNASQTAKKADLLNDEDSKPQPPPPLFGDDSDDDDLDWLS